MDLRCRTCYKVIDEKKGLNILTERPYRTHKGDLSLANMLFECTSVNALEEDHISKIKERKFMVCRGCISDLIKSYSFRIRCLESQKLFNKYNKPNANDTDDARKNNYSAIFLIDTDEFKDDEQIMNCGNDQVLNCDDNKENFNENTTVDENSLNSDEEDEYCLDNEKDEIKKINNYIKFCARTSGIKEEEILRIIDNETPDAGEVVIKKPKNLPIKEDNKKLDAIKEDNKKLDEESAKKEEIDKQVAEYLSKKEKVLSSTTT
ncbi:uncharacterized protein LOC123300046 [Chrysoperla carnea]|uniref:uncharacterized protein LOC123300046 n=1 Tax=Chrysoperla carnea TaxID=189513 RepID=UPI001D067B80|nr:uncharacterized protein LOC123300046 [Chrysoperla carnea]